MAQQKKELKQEESSQIEDDEPEEVEDEGGGGAPEWMTTYGDLVTLLFAFFVLLYSMSSVQQESFKELVNSLESALGVQKVPEAGTREGLQMPKPPKQEEKPKEEAAADQVGAMVQKEINNITSDVRELVLFNQLGGKVKVEGNANGAVITISDIILFPPGEATMTPGGIDIIKKITKILSQFSYHIKIAGYTDNTPIHTAMFPSNWELSANRACEVVRMLVNAGIDPKLLAAVGYGEYHPIASNDTEEGRAQNRRVEIIYERQAIEQKLANK
jgi:chemotaxis protein MotB